jgi:hypothetical protein
MLYTIFSEQVKMGKNAKMRITFQHLPSKDGLPKISQNYTGN